MQLQDVESFYPLSPLQQGILFHSLSDPSSRMYFNQTLATLRGDLDADAFRSAWQSIVDRHPILRTFFVWEGVKTPVQVVKKAAAMPFTVEDWSHLTPEEHGARIEELRRTDLEEGFDLSRAPLMRAVLLRVAADRHEFLWTCHHILMDGWSMFHVLQDLFGEYDARRAGRTTAVPTPPPYRDYIAWLQKQSLPRAESFWRPRLAGFDSPTPLPGDGPPLPGTERSSSQEDFATLPVFLSAETSAALQTLAKERRLTPNTILQGAWALLLSRYSGEPDVLFGAVVAGRPADLPGVEAMVGLFINTLPVRVEIPAAQGLVAWLQELQIQQAELREYEYSPLVEVQTWSDVPGGTSLFETIFLFENYHKDGSIEDMCQSLEIADVRWFERHNYPIAALAIPGPEMMLRIIYQTQRFSAATIQRMLEHWRALLEEMVARPDAPLDELSLLTAAERHQLVLEWNDTRTAYPRERCIHELFEEQVRAAPEAPALVSGEGTLSYRELDARANRLARRLRGLSVGPEVLVGVCMERSPELVVGILAILKAGGAYVALDPDYPADRLELMLADTQTPVLLTQERLAAKLPAHDAQVILLDADWDSIATESDEPLPSRTAPEDLAYVSYTSGSTGRPKGTCVPHRAVVRLVRDTNFIDIGTDDVFLQFATVSFDASTLELWGSLCNGARLAIFPPGTPSLEEIGRVIEERGVTILWLTAGLFHQMVERHPQGLRGVRQLLAGGDVLSVQHVQKALSELPGCVLINGYGPTENTTFTCCHRMTCAEEIGRTVPIGRPISNTTVYVLDGGLRPVPIGVVGDLYAGGDGLARGYLHHPALTAEKFVPDPFATEPGATEPGATEPGSRLYRTGDRARYLPDGTVEFLGRNDFQVKIRGFRIELGEIEVALGSHPAVRDAVVMASADASGDKRLVAYVVADAAAPTTVGDLRTHLEVLLPEYMVPAAFVTLDAFPLTQNGKVDRRALPDPEGTRPELDTAYAAPEADAERQIAAIWQAVLGLEKVGVHDNFFDLGGHSLSMIRVHAALQKALSRELRMVDLFKFPTVSALARHLEEGPAETTAPAASTEKIRAGQSRLQQMRERRKRLE